MVLNFLSRPPKATLALSQPRNEASSLRAEYEHPRAMQEKSARNAKIFCVAQYFAHAGCLRGPGAEAVGWAA